MLDVRCWTFNLSAVLSAVGIAKVEGIAKADVDDWIFKASCLFSQFLASLTHYRTFPTL